MKNDLYYLCTLNVLVTKHINDISQAFTMTWDELAQLHIPHPEFFAHIFAEMVHNLTNTTQIPTTEEQEFSEYYLITEQNRMQSYFLHIVPKPAYELFRKMQTQGPHQMLGYTVLVGKYNNKEVRVSCFGIPCTIAARALVRKGK